MHSDIVCRPLKKKGWSIGLSDLQFWATVCFYERLHKESHLDHRVVVLPQAIHVPMVGEYEGLTLLVISNHQTLLTLSLDDCQGSAQNCCQCQQFHLWAWPWVMVHDNKVIMTLLALLTWREDHVITYPRHRYYGSIHILGQGFF